MVDGPTDVARFGWPCHLCPATGGALYLEDRGAIRRVQLPPASWHAGKASGGPTEEASTVTTLARHRPLSPSNIRSLIFHHSSNALLFSTPGAAHRLQLGANAPGDPTPEPKLLAGYEGVEEAVHHIHPKSRSLVVDGDGCVYAIDSEMDSSNTWVRKLSLDGSVTTLAELEASAHSVSSPVILPNGYLAMCGLGHKLWLLDLGLQPPRIPAPPSNRPPPRSLSGDLASLLFRQPDGSADVTVVVGGRSFPAHRVILASRCDYFRQRLEGGFEDGASAVLTLSDVDPDAFALLLRFMYTGSTSGTSGTSGGGPSGSGGFSDKGHGGSGIPAELARSVAELADRLLLPELCREAQEVVLAGVGPESVVGAMLWAEGRGSGFGWLLGRLKAWYLGHCGELLQAAPGAVKRLMREGPDLMVELLREGYARTSKMARK